MKREYMRLVCFMMVVLLFASFLVGCANSEQPESSATNESPLVSEGPTVSEENTPMKLSFAQYATEIELRPFHKEYFTKLTEEDLNIDVEITYNARDTYKERLNVMIAADQIPNVIYLDDFRMIGEAIENDLLVDLDPIVENHPVWSKIPKDVLRGGIFKGKYYFLVNTYTYPPTLYYRADWVNKLGLNIPTNTDELYEFLYAFAHGDPNNTGKKDTYGFTMINDFHLTQSIWGMFVPSTPKNAGLYIDEQSDTVKSVLYLEEDMKKALSWLNKAYSEEVLDRQFVLNGNKDAENRFLNGEVGVWLKEPEWIIPRYNKMSEQWPDVDLTSLPAIQGPYGSNYKVEDTKYVGYYLTRTVEDIERGREFMAYYQGPEFVLNMAYGPEGETWAVENGQFKWLDEDVRKSFNPGSLALSVFDIELREPVEVLETNIKNAEGTVTVTGVSLHSSESVEFQKNAADIDKTTIEYIVKIIIGEKPVDEYSDLLAEVKKMGLDALIEDVNSIYKMSK